MSGLITIIVILVILWWLNNNKSTTKDKTIIKEVKTFKTNDGYISYEREREIDERKMDIAKEGIREFQNRQNSPVVAEKIVNSSSYSKSTVEQPRTITRENKPVARTETIKTSHPAKDIKTYSVESYLKNKGESLTPTLLEMAERLSKNKQAPSGGGAIEKQCQNCHQSLPAASFRASSKNPDGLTKWCINCLGSSTARRGRFKMCPKCGKRRMKSSFDQNSPAEQL